MSVIGLQSQNQDGIAVCVECLGLVLESVKTEFLLVVFFIFLENAFNSIKIK